MTIYLILGAIICTIALILSRKAFESLLLGCGYVITFLTVAVSSLIYTFAWPLAILYGIWKESFKEA